MKFYITLIIVPLVLSAACSRRSDDGGSSGSSGNIYGQVIVDQMTCGTTVATINLGGASAGGQAYSRQVTSGATFDFGAIRGTFTLSVQAGNCYVQAQNVGPVTQGQTPYRVCLTTNPNFCNQNGYYKMAATTTAPVQAKSSSVSSMKSCNWITYGCNRATFPGSGSAVTVNRSLYFYPESAVNGVTVLQNFKNSNSVNLFATPTLGSSGWNMNAAPESVLTLDKVNYDFLNVDSQFDHSVLQNTEGACVTRSEMLNWISNYLKDNGYKAKSAENFLERNKGEVPPNEKLCIYPQAFAQTDAVAEYQSTEDLELKRVWFLIIPELHAEVRKLRVPSETMTAWFQKPTSDLNNPAIASKSSQKPTSQIAKIPSSSTKPTRAVANKYYLPTEEIALVFLLEN
ncbi:MAG: hypothetical protein ACK5WZ_02895 [Pseudobdellovibrionaceae bacterium]